MAMTIIARLLTVAAVLAALLLGATVPPTGAPTVTAAALTAPLPAFCPLGKAHPGGSGCRGGSLTKAPNAHATVGPVTVNCSVGSCTLYLARGATRAVAAKVRAMPELTSTLDQAEFACTVLGVVTEGVGPVACSAIAASYRDNVQAARKAVVQAAGEPGKGACFAMKRSHFFLTGQTTYLVRNGKYCHD